MNRRLILLLLLVIGLLGLLVCWPRLSRELTTADLTLSASSQPREEVVVSGYVKNFGASPFSLETLLIEEPGKEPYRRQVSLDADRRFELALGKPVAGTYRIALRTRKQQWGGAAKEDWLKLPDLVIESSGLSRPKTVRTKDFDNQRLTVFGGAGLAIIAVLAVGCLWPRSRVKKDLT